MYYRSESFLRKQHLLYVWRNMNRRLQERKRPKQIPTSGRSLCFVPPRGRSVFLCHHSAEVRVLVTASDRNVFFLYQQLQAAEAKANNTKVHGNEQSRTSASKMEKT